MRKFHFRFTFPIVLLIVLFLLNIFILRIPLVGIFGYEFAFLNAVVLYLIGGFCVIHFSRQIGKDEFKLKLIFYANWEIFSTLIAIPFCIGLIASLFFSRCPLQEGIPFYLVITVPAYLLGISTATYSSAVSRKYSYVIFLLGFIVVLLFPLKELFFTPQVYFYNPIIGYFPGTIYDERISINRLLIAYRILNISFAIALIYIASSIQNRKLTAKVISFLGIFALTIVFSFLKPPLLLSTNKETLNAKLQTSTSTDNFVIHFKSKTMFDNSTKYLALLHEYYLDRVKTQLHVPFRTKIDLYIFRNKEEKQELIGAENANVAKPWLKQIYLNYGDYEETLKHELVHVVAGDFGTTPLRVADNFNSAMIEGLAVAIDDNYDGLPVHNLAKLAWESNYRVSIPALFEGANFFSQTSSVSYVYAGSFVKYLIENFGIQKVERLYSNMDFKKLCGKNINLLAEDYYRFLSDYKIDYNKNKAQLYFGSKPIFKKYCPRFAANQTREASIYLQKNKLANALDLFKKVYSYSNSYNSLIGIVNVLSKQKKYYDASVYLKNEISKFRTDQNYFVLELNLGDLLVKSGQSKTAVVEYDSLLVQSPHIEYSNEMLIRKAFLFQGVDSLQSYLNSSDSLKLKKLIHLNEKEIRYFSISRIIRLAENTHEDISPFLIGLKQKSKVDNYESGYAVLRISRYFLRQMDLDNAQFFAIKTAHTKLEEDIRHIFVENLRMVNWFKNFSNELKVN